jgi:hypothetical protein
MKRKAASNKSSASNGLRITAEALVWQVVCTELRTDRYTLTVREIAARTGLCVGAVHRTLAWRLYRKGRAASRERRRRERNERCVRREDC